MTKLTLAAWLLGTFSSLAGAQVSVSAYDYCGDQRQALVRIDGPASETCKQAVHDVGQCCSGTRSGCFVPPDYAAGTVGQKNSGDVTAQANAQLAANLEKLISVCDNSEMQALIKCSGSPQDKDFEKKYRRAEGAFTSCLQVAKNDSISRAVAGGATAEAAGAVNLPVHPAPVRARKPPNRS